MSHIYDSEVPDTARLVSRTTITHGDEPYQTLSKTQNNAVVERVAVVHPVPACAAAMIEFDLPAVS